MKLELQVEYARPGFRLSADLQLEGNAAGVFGPSGAGKTTLLHLLSGLLRPQSGRIALDGEVLYDSRIFVPAHHRHIGLVFQDARLFPHLNVEGNLRFGESLLPARERRIRFDEVVELLEIGPLLERRAHRLSGGERQRVALGRALLASPRLLLLDEPLSSLDRRLKAQILPYLRRVHRVLGVPLLIVSHDLGEILHLTDRLVVLDQGQVVGHGRYLDLAQDERAAGILRTSGLLNVLRLRPVEHRPEHGISLLAFADAGPDAGTVVVPYRDDFADEVEAVLRPEDIALSLARVEHISIQNQLPGEIAGLHQAGTHVLCVVHVGTDLLVEITHQALETLALTPGRRVWCLFKAHALQPLEMHEPSTQPTPEREGVPVAE
ncbi:MAG: molybdenum ABC transporter ATP-binding protein [Armatimonadota bacterium]